MAGDAVHWRRGSRRTGQTGVRDADVQHLRAGELALIPSLAQASGQRPTLHETIGDLSEKRPGGVLRVHDLGSAAAELEELDGDVAQRQAERRRDAGNGPDRAIRRGDAPKQRNVHGIDGILFKDVGTHHPIEAIVERHARQANFLRPLLILIVINGQHFQIGCRAHGVRTPAPGAVVILHVPIGGNGGQ